MDCADKSFLLAHLPAQPWQQLGKHLAAHLLRQRGVFLAAEGFLVAALFPVGLFNVCGSLFNEVEREIVAFLFVIGPVDQAVLAEHHALRIGMFPANRLQLQPQLEARAQPRRPHNVIAVHFLGNSLGVFRGTNRDGRIRVGVIHVLAGHKRMQRRVDGRRARVEVERAVRVHAHHLVLRRRLGPALFLVRVDGLQRNQFLLIQRSEILLLGRAQVAARAFDPQHLHLFARERIGLHEFAGGIAAAGIGDALIAAELVGAIDQPIGRVQFLDLTILPEVVHILIFLLSHGKSERQFSGKTAADSSQYKILRASAPLRDA